MSKKKQLTTGAGQPVGYNQNALTAGSRGPILLQDYQLLEKMGKKTLNVVSIRPSKCIRGYSTSAGMNVSGC